MRIKGLELAKSDDVVVDGETVATKFVSMAELEAPLPETRLKDATTLKVLVRRPGAQPVQSNEFELEIETA